jgi:hypothetical protein
MARRRADIVRAFATQRIKTLISLRTFSTRSAKFQDCMNASAAISPGDRVPSCTSTRMEATSMRTLGWQRRSNALGLRQGRSKPHFSRRYAMHSRQYMMLEAHVGRQILYIPTGPSCSHMTSVAHASRCHTWHKLGETGLEPATPGPPDQYSNHLSYSPAAGSQSTASPIRRSRNRGALPPDRGASDR